MSGMGEMHPDLMHPAGFGKTAHEGKLSLRSFETSFHLEPRHALPA